MNDHDHENAAMTRVKPIDAEVLAKAKRWLAKSLGGRVGPSVDGHVMADYLAKALVAACEPPSIVGLSTTEFSVERNLPRDQRQAMIASWAELAFGTQQATSLPQRALRLLEEAVEAFQACGGQEAKAHELASYVFGREKGQVGQELGGVAVCVLALAAAAGLSADEEEAREVHRVLSKPIAEFTARNAAKNAAGFLVDGTPVYRLSEPGEIATRGWGGNSCCGRGGLRQEGDRRYCAACGRELRL